MAAVAPGSGQSGTDRDQTFIGAIDQGTTSTRFMIFDVTGQPIATHQIEFTQSHPHPG